MKTSPELEVTLSADLYRRLRRESRRLGVPMTYLVASVVVDTLDEVQPGAEDESATCLEPALAG